MSIAFLLYSSANIMLSKNLYLRIFSSSNLIFIHKYGCRQVKTLNKDIYEVSRILFFVSPSQTIRWRRKEVLAEVDHRRIECPLIHLPTGRTFHLGKKC